ncbi:allophanate hydrolase [Segniliparus rugosus]|uniref:Allophanate hydrolase n=1 Tax=Segniliparus rugosus (strain ATCC BAA-974 / DSM 45345 / CCUG 50838 / CIP 108380 / JCM 13579 / CDC 945) TaxID=679197 RepID=U1M1G3_SEGRC|nr:allophanate hydrolase [Segniliparus rugosus]ERG69222.1 allophanate hydrolase [Segniliparus rugosus ATCC BAA-974]
MGSGFEAPDGRSHTPAERVRAAYARIAEADRPEVWTALRPEADALADSAEVEARLERGETLPLAGLLVAVKDNIDVAGLPTTAACPAYAYRPETTAASVERLVRAGAVVLGKTNMDQFATGLVGTRSPYGPVRNALRPELVSGGSSSGSAVAVALGIADLALGTDTAGSGRVPAALNGLVGIKPTLGLVPNHGVVHACADYDSVTVFAAGLDLAALAMAVMIGPEARDPRSRAVPAEAKLAAPSRPTLAVPAPANLAALSPAYREAFARTLAALPDTVELREVDVAPLLDAALLLYDGAIVAERHAAVGAFVEAAPAEDLDPTVAAIIRAAANTTGPGFARDLGALAAARAEAARLLAGADGLLLPTTTEHPAIAAVHADPVAINRRMGTYTNFCNLLDMAAVAVPGQPTSDGLPFGVMVVAGAFADQVALDVAATIVGAGAPPLLFPPAAELAVFGAHLRGQPLHWQLEAIGARFAGEIATSDAYRLAALDTAPPKPGVVRRGQGLGSPISGELYQVSAAGLGSFLAALPAPMALTSVELADGRQVVGFACAHDALDGAEDITGFGGWRAYLEHLRQAPSAV